MPTTITQKVLFCSLLEWAAWNFGVRAFSPLEECCLLSGYASLRVKACW